MLSKTTPRKSFTALACLVLAFLLMMIASPAQAQTDCGCDHIIGPDKSHVRATDMPQVKPGDVVCIKGGVRGRLKFIGFEGTKEQPIIFKNCGGKVIFDNTEMDGTFSFEKCSFFRVTGTGDPNHKYGFLLRTATKGSAMYVSKTDFEIDHVEIASAGFAGMMIKIDPLCDNTQFHKGNFIMKNVSVHDNFIHNTHGEGLYIGNTWFHGKELSCGTVYPHEIQGLRVYNNTTQDTGADGIQISSANKDVEVYNNLVLRYGQDPFKPVQVNGMMIGGGSTGKYYNNQIIDGAGMGIQCLGIGDLHLFNNLIVKAGVDGIFIDDRNKNWPGTGFYTYNNTVVSPGRDAIRMYARSTVGNTFINNLLVAPGSLGTNYYNKNQYLYIIDNTVQYTQNNNLFIATVDAAGFVNPAAGDYRLKAESPAVDKGANISTFNFDLDKNLRPQGAAFDVGAQEYFPLP